MAYQIRAIVGLQGEDHGYGGQQPTWMPTDFGQARMAAEAWLLSIATKKGTGDEYLVKRREAWQSKKEDSRATWDWYYLQSVRQDGPELYEATKAIGQKLKGETPQASIDSGATLVTLADLEKTEVKELLFPDLSKYLKVQGH